MTSKIAPSPLILSLSLTVVLLSACSSAQLTKSNQSNSEQLKKEIKNMETKKMAIKRMDNVLIVVEDLASVKKFFIDLGLKLEGEANVEGPEVGALIGLKDVKATIVSLRTPDGQGIELDKFHTPQAVGFGPVNTPVNALGMRRIMFGVEGIDAVVAHMKKQGSELIGEMKYGDSYKLAYIRGPEGIIVGLAEKL